MQSETKLNLILLILVLIVVVHFLYFAFPSAFPSIRCSKDTQEEFRFFRGCPYAPYGRCMCPMCRRGCRGGC